MKLALLSVLVLALGASATEIGKQDKNYPPPLALPGDRPIPSVTVSLDDPPATRWNKVMAEGNFDFAPMPVAQPQRPPTHIFACALTVC